MTTAVFASEADNTPTRAEILATIPDIAPSGQIVIGTTVWPSENIMAGWDTLFVNTDIRNLMFRGLDTMERDINGHWFANPIVVRDIEITDNADGSRTYTFTIYTQNRFSDGTYITARHYAANLVFFNHPYFLEQGSFTTVGHDIVGQSAWLQGDADTFAGVRLYSDEQFSVTIDAEHLPCVWEAIRFMNHSPLPYHAIIPAATLVDNGDGVFFDRLTSRAMDRGLNGADRPFSNDFTRNLGLAGGSASQHQGYRFHPTVVPGPYRFVGTDHGNGVITLEANPYFPGTWDGYRPRIQTIMFSYFPAEIIVQAMVVGEIDIIASQGSGVHDIVNPALERLVEAGTHQYISYPRNGYGLIRFHVDHGPTQFVEVRQAIKWLLDRELFGDIFTGGHAMVVQGQYSPAHWWYQEALERGFYDRLTTYYFNPDRAIEVLEAGGWVLNSQGQPFRPGIDAVRYKDISSYDLLWDTEWGFNQLDTDPSITGNLMRLEIYWSTFSVNRVTDIIAYLLPHEMEAIGMQLTPHLFDGVFPLVALARSYGIGPEFHMFNIAQNFATAHSPWNALNPDWELLGGWNSTFTRDQDLFELANRLRFMDISTRDGRDEFVDAWIDLAEELNHQVLEIPLYVDMFFDFIPIGLQNWSNNHIWGVSPAIIRAYIVE